MTYCQHIDDNFVKQIDVNFIFDHLKRICGIVFIWRPGEEVNMERLKHRFISRLFTFFNENNWYLRNKIKHHFNDCQLLLVFN